MMSKKVFIIKDDTKSPRSDRQFSSIRLPSACGGSLHCLLDQQRRQLLELNVLDDGPRSWFIDDSVSSDGLLYVATPLNPLFTILFYLYQSRSCAQPLQQLLIDSQFADAEKLCQLVTHDQLLAMCVSKGDSETRAYQYSESLALDWLESRTRVVSECLLQQQQQQQQRSAGVTGGGGDTHYVEAVKQRQSPVIEASSSDADVMCLSTACGILSSYVWPEMAVMLRERLGLPAVKRPVSHSDLHNQPDPASKRQKVCSVTPHEDYSAAAASSPDPTQSNLTTKQKSLAKAASGSKSILSFFAKAK